MMNSMKTPQEIAEMISKRFYPLPDADLDSLASIIESSKAAKGELLLDNGQISKYLYYVESGLLRQFYYKNKRDITEHFSCEGNIVICIASTFQREPTRLLIEALEPTVYHRISFSEFSDLLKTSLAINRLYQKILEWALMLSHYLNVLLIRVPPPLTDNRGLIAHIYRFPSYDKAIIPLCEPLYMN